MYAVISVSGHQYRVATGDQLLVSRLQSKEGETIQLPSLLVADGVDVKLGKDAANVSVSAKVISHQKGEKITVSRFRAKSRHRRKVGFRPMYTLLQIESIGESKKPKLTAEKVTKAAKSVTKKSTLKK